MGYALARAAHEAGAVVTLVSGPTGLAAPHGVARIDVDGAAQMHEQVLAQADTADVFIAVAAVADWRAAAPSTTKIKKQPGTPPEPLPLATNPDILASVAALPSPPLCVGFAAESERLVENARAKLMAKGVTMIIANQVEAALGADAVELVLVDASTTRTLPMAPKLKQARRIVAAIAQRLDTHMETAQ